MTDADLSAWTPWTAPGCLSRCVDGPDGRVMDLLLAVPEGDAPSGGWPLLLALDGGRFFGALAGAAAALSQRTGKTGVAPLAVVALAHRPEGGAVEDQRVRDFTRAPRPSFQEAKAGGEGEAFQRWLAEALLPLLSAAAPVDTGRATLFGHSLGGLFVLETLETQPALFARWVAISPSLWWSTPSPDIAGPHVLIGCGEAETAREMRGRIAAWASAQTNGAVFKQAPGADHGSAPFALIPDILRHASGAAPDRRTGSGASS